MDGLDAGWIDAGAERTAAYNNVAPGRYRFELTAHNGDGVWTEPCESLELVVEPHLWQRWWFVGMASVVGAAGLAGAGRYFEKRRMRARMRRLELERAMERERARIAQDLHDDLGSSLTEIGFLSTLARSPSLPESEGRQCLSQITERSRDLVKALDEIVWAVNPSNDSLSNAVNYLCLFTEELLRAAGIRCRLDVAADLPQKLLNAEQRHNLFLAVKEALANAAKHSGAREVLLRFEWVDSALIITVQDNGRGFNPASVPPGRNGLANLNARVSGLGGRCNITSKSGEGAVVRLELPVP